MTITADFYDGRGRHAVWFGSLQTDADPETVRGVPCGRLLLAAVDPLTFADAVADLLDVWADEGLGHGYHPRDGWPWPFSELQSWGRGRSLPLSFNGKRDQRQVRAVRSWNDAPRDPRGMRHGRGVVGRASQHQTPRRGADES
jgi:hypothetical protein